MCPLFDSSVDDLDEFLSREDKELLDHYAAFVRDDERYDAAQEKLDSYNDSLGLEQISVRHIMGFIESYGGDAPMRPTPKVVRDLTAIFRFSPCKIFESETGLDHCSIYETHYHRYSLDGKNIGEEISPIQDTEKIDLINMPQRQAARKFVKRWTFRCGSEKGEGKTILVS